MKITLTSPGIYPYVLGGIQRHSFNLARHLARLGVKVDLYHTDFEKSDGIDDLQKMSKIERKNIISLSIPWPTGDRLPGHYVRSLKRFSQRIFEIYQQRSPADFIYGQGLTAWAFTQAKHQGQSLPPVAVNLHGYEMFQAPANVKAFLESKLLQPAFHRQATDSDYVVSLGGKLTTLAQERLNIPAARIVELNVGIDKSWITTTPLPVNRPLRFVFVGRYERRKGIEELHAVIAANLEWRSRAEFHFIGPIPKNKRLTLSHVTYAGKITDETVLQQALRRSDVLICPSHSEGMPTVILEAMASGLAVVATDVGAVRLMVDCENGELLPHVGLPALSKSISQLIALDSEKLLAMKQVSLKRVQAFFWEKIASKTLSFMKSV